MPTLTQESDGVEPPGNLVPDPPSLVWTGRYRGGVAVEVRTPTSSDTWPTLPGDTRWVDHSQRVGPEGELTVYLHVFRRHRVRDEPGWDLLGWKPGTTKVAHVYEPGEWVEVVAETQEWPPARLERVPHLDRPPREPRRR